jgi:hypothetical protein
MSMPALNRILREPLFHFVLIGAALFALYRWAPGRGTTDPAIVVTPGRVESIATAFRLTWQRPPSAAELDGLIQDFVREEVAVREAMTLGLDREDVVVRRRLRQKLERVAADNAASAEPTDDQLGAWLAAHPADFAVEPRFSFTQVYFDPRRRGGQLASDAARMLAALQRAGAGADVATMGDAFVLGRQFEALPARDLKSQFGDPFAAALDTLAVGRWVGPIASTYGAHLVLLRDRTPARHPALAEVRDAVRREWSNAQKEQATERLYQRLLAHYTVTIGKARPAGAETVAGMPR